MNKKSFNWVGFILVIVFVFGLLFFAFAIYQCKTFPNSIVANFFGGVGEGVFFLSFFGIFYLVFGGIFTVLFYKASTKRLTNKSAFFTSHEFKTSAEVISKTTQISGSAYSTGTTYYISFALTNKARKNFPVNVNVYNTIIEGDTGILTYKEQGNCIFFIDFQPQN